MATISERLQQWQHELLDLTNRNPLLNFRISTSRPSTITLIASDSTEIFAWLMQGKALTILGTEPAAGDSAEDTRDDAFESDGTDGSLGGENRTSPPRPGTALTNLIDERAHRVLLRLAARARAAELEQGINTLFAAFGLLRWQERDGNQAWQFAPLVMLPLRIEEITRDDRFRVATTGDEPEFNQTLVERLRRDFGLDLTIDIDEESDLGSVLDAIRRSVSGRSGWEVRGEVHIGHFQYFKLRMYEDLIEHASIAADHTVIQALASDLATFAPLPTDLPSEANLDRAVSPEHTFTILDADASQFLAVQAANRGNHLIIQGPPGTGKSQTIANIVAESIAAGKKVLFVSEKAAAIDVVHRRLAQQGLADYCLMLHSHKANKREIVHELARQIDRTPQPVPTVAEQRALVNLQERRLALNDYADALHRDRAPLQSSVFSVIGQLAQLSEVPLLTTDPRLFRALTPDQLERGTHLLADLALFADVLAEGDQHPWAGAKPEIPSYGERQRLQELLQALSADIDTLTSAGQSLARNLGLTAATSVADYEKLLRIADAVSEDLPLQRSWLVNDGADKARDTLADARERAVSARRITQQLGHVYEEAFLELDPAPAIAAYEQGMFSRLFSSTYRAHRQRLGAVTKGQRNRTHGEDLIALHDARRRREILSWFETHQELLSEHLGLGSAAAAQLTDQEAIRLQTGMTAATEMIRCLDANPVPIAFVMAVSDQGTVSRIVADRARLRTALDNYTTRMSTLGQYFADGPVPDHLDGNLREIAQLLRKRMQRLPDLDRWVRTALAHDQVTNAGLSPVYAEVSRRRIPADQWSRTYRRFALTAWLDGVLASEPVLHQFDGQMHDRAVIEFTSLDRACVGSAPRRVQSSWSSRIPPVSAAFGGEPGLLRFEAAKRKRHIPLRRLFAQIPNLLPILKPCLMMSPLSVAHYLPADLYRFDVVIFDEASQVRPHDAIGSIMRGTQLIVAGDSQQLPPTSFFDRADDELETEDGQDIRALESILDALEAKGMPKTRLLWHYRSRHEALISYSNYHFYEGQLITFPSPGDRQSTQAGVRLDYVADGRYVDERDRVLKTPIRINRVEAKRVARLVMEHARLRPKESLLVVTLGMRQREVVEEEISNARRLELDLEDFFREDKPEPFYVKALEQVQGDERDVILISVGYGKNDAGVLSHNFGPINQQGGERRLNVLVTRARNQVILVSSIRYHDIDSSKTQNRGPKLLRDYLEFAETGSLPVTDTTVGITGASESPFEEEVAAALIRAGYTVHRQVGASRYRIDLGIVDPRDPGHYVLGVECDGKTYHQAKTARDRDRLRQEVLENLGWNIHRIWSTEWMRNPDQELNRVVARVDALLRSSPPQDRSEETTISPPLTPRLSEEIGGVDPVAPDPTPSTEQPSDHPPVASPYRRASFVVPPTNLWETPLAQVVDAAVRCVEIEGPIHRELLQRRLTLLWGHQRAGSRITDKVEQATAQAVSRDFIRRRGDFFWPKFGSDVVPRGPSEDGEQREIEHIPDEELVAAAWAILERALSLSQEELIVQEARVFGYQRTGVDIRKRLLEVTDAMAHDGLIEIHGDRVRLTRRSGNG